MAQLSAPLLAAARDAARVAPPRTCPGRGEAQACEQQARLGPCLGPCLGACLGACLGPCLRACLLYRRWFEAPEAYSVDGPHELGYTEAALARHTQVGAHGHACLARLVRARVRVRVRVSGQGQG